MGMMIRAIEHAKESRKKYIYLGSFQRPTDTYKLQFKGLEWFGGEKWSNDLEKLKKIMRGINPGPDSIRTGLNFLAPIKSGPGN